MIARSRWLSAFLGSALLAFASGCGDNGSPAVSDTTPPPPPAPGAAGVTVTIPSGASALTDDAFGENPLMIAAGTTVTWVNNDNVAHTATSSSDPRVFDSGLLQPGQTFSFTFETPGVFPYFCQPHPNMVGTVQVNDPSPTPTPTPAITYSVSLSGDQEVPPVMTSGSGTAEIEIEQEREIKFTLNVTGLADIQAAHIHVGEAGTNGPVIFNLSAVPFSGTINGSLEAEDLLARPMEGVSSFQEALSALRAGRTYINVHTAANPGGEIRAQIQ